MVKVSASAVRQQLSPSMIENDTAAMLTAPTGSLGPSVLLVVASMVRRERGWGRMDGWLHELRVASVHSLGRHL